jgi:hypothetical protein
MKEQSLCRQQMSRDLMKVYREVYQDVPLGTTQTEVYEMVVAHPAPRFYIDPRKAHERISPMMRGDMSHLEKFNPLKRQMYMDLFEVVMNLSHKKHYRSLYALLKDAVLENAPRFYIGAKRMSQIWQAENIKTRIVRQNRTRLMNHE